MSNNSKIKILKGAVTTAALAGIVMPAGEIGATTVVSNSQTEEIKAQEVGTNTNDSNSSNVTGDNANIIPISDLSTNLGSSNVVTNEQNINNNGSNIVTGEQNINGTGSNNVVTNDQSVNTGSNIVVTETNSNNKDSNVNDMYINNLNSNISNSLNNVIKTKSNLPEVPYFYYWTVGEGVITSWDYGHIANRPSKIEAVIDTNVNFSNPSYIKVKAKGAEFVPDLTGDFYLRIRFFDSSGNVTHESIRKVVRNSSETREIKGLRYAISGTGIKVSWNNFTDGIKSGQVIVDGKPHSNLTLSDIKNNSVVVNGISEGSEVKLKIMGNNGLEYNGVVFVEKGTFNSVSNINLSLSKDGVGINVDLLKTNFKQGNKFSVKVTQKSNNEVIVSGSSFVLSSDKGSFTIYPDAGKTFMNDDYTVSITDLGTGAVYNYDYSHSISEIDNMVSVGLSDGRVVASWNKINGVVSSELMWSTSEDFSDYKSIEIGSGKTGVSFNTNLNGGKIVYLLLTNYDAQGRIVSQDVDAVVVGNVESKLENFKGVYKNDTSAEFSWKNINSNVVGAILKVNDNIIVLSKSELATLNDVSSLITGGFKKGNKYNVSLYLLDSNGKVYSGSVSEILEQSSSYDGSVSIEGVSGINAKYIPNPGVLTLSLDASMYDVANNSAIGILLNGQKLSNVSGIYVPESKSINIEGLIPTKSYRNISLSYVSKSGENKAINIPSLTINGGSPLDSFLVNAYNKAVSRDTQNIDEEGYGYWKKNLLNRNITLSYFIRNFAYVPEFMNLVNSPQDLITRLYNVLVLRDPEPEGLQFWTSVYNQLVSNGVSHKESTIKILIDMTTSSEFANLAGRLGVNP